MLHQHTDSICTSICRDHDGKVTPEEVAAAAAYLKDTIGKEGVQEFISNLSKDKGPLHSHDFPVVLMIVLHCLLTTFYATEGKILVEDIVKLASQTDENNEDQEEESRQ